MQLSVIIKDDFNRIVLYLDIIPRTSTSHKEPSKRPAEFYDLVRDSRQNGVDKIVSFHQKSSCDRVELVTKLMKRVNLLAREN